MITEALLVISLLLSAYLVYLLQSQKKYLRLMGTLLIDNSKDTQDKVSSLQEDLSEAQKKLDTVGKILNIYESETRILQKHREEVKKIQSRFQKREVR